MLCKEILRLSQGASLRARESDGVEPHMCALARLERVWGESEASINGGTTQLASNDSMAGEESERRLFTEALWDAYFLYQ